jgi:hypothetical protein
MSSRSKAILDKLRRLRGENEPLIIVIQGNPDARPERPMVSNREAMIENTYFKADEGESVASFHNRLRAIYRETGAKGIIVLGDRSNAVEPARPIFDHNGQPITPDATRH